MIDRPAYWPLISDPFKKYFYFTTATVSIFSNCLLLILIFTTASMRTDKYRYLLITFAIGDMISALSHSWTGPIVHLTTHGFFFIPKHANDLKSENDEWKRLVFALKINILAVLGKAAALFYVMTYYETFNILAFHFIYRYMMIVQGKLKEMAAGWRLGHWLAIASVFLVAHSTLMVWAMSFSSVTNPYSVSLDPSEFIDLYGVNTSDPTVGYVTIEIRRLNKATGLEEYNGPTIMTFCVIMGGFGLPLNVMIFCSFFIIKALQSIDVSMAMKAQQRLFFRALLVQTLVPCIFSYFPLCIIWLWPLFTGIALGPLGNVLIMSSVIFPSVDAIMIIIFIPAYRQNFKTFIMNKIRPKKESTHVTAFTVSQTTETGSSIPN